MITLDGAPAIAARRAAGPRDLGGRSRVVEVGCGTDGEGVKWASRCWCACAYRSGLVGLGEVGMDGGGLVASGDRKSVGKAGGCRAGVGGETAVNLAARLRSWEAASRAWLGLVGWPCVFGAMAARISVLRAWMASRAVSCRSEARGDWTACDIGDSDDWVSIGILLWVFAFCKCFRKMFVSLRAVVG